MITASFRLEGFDGIGRAIRALPEAVTDRIAIAALTAGAEPMRARMAELAPRDDAAPHLSENIIVAPMTAKRGGIFDDDSYLVAVGPRKAKWLSYAVPLEFGSVRANGRHVPARPFARPAFDGTVEQTTAAIGVALQSAIARASGGRA